jgi:hypothetical protein
MAVSVSQTNQRPKGVHTAVIILWVTVGIGVLDKFLAVLAKTAHTGFSMQFITMVGSMAVLIVMIGQRRNWARITFLVLYLFGLILTVPALPALLILLRVRPLSFFLTLALTVLQTVALILLFQREASEWFRARHQQRPESVSPAIRF